MSSNYQIWTKKGKMWENIDKHGVLPVPVSTSRQLFNPEKRLGYRVAWWLLVITKYEKKNMGKYRKIWCKTTSTRTPKSGYLKVLMVYGKKFVRNGQLFRTLSASASAALPNHAVKMATENTKAWLKSDQLTANKTLTIIWFCQNLIAFYCFFLPAFLKNEI